MRKTILKKIYLFQYNKKFVNFNFGEKNQINEIKELNKDKKENKIENDQSNHKKFFFPRITITNEDFNKMDIKKDNIEHHNKLAHHDKDHHKELDHHDNEHHNKLDHKDHNEHHDEHHEEDEHYTDNDGRLFGRKVIKI
jgi:hypothetical protein